MSLNYIKSLFLSLKKKKKLFSSFFLPHESKLLKKLFTKIRDEKNNFLKFRNQNSILPKKESKIEIWKEVT